MSSSKVVESHEALVSSTHTLGHSETIGWRSAPGRSRWCRSFQSPPSSVWSCLQRWATSFRSHFRCAWVESTRPLWDRCRKWSCFGSLGPAAHPKTGILSLYSEVYTWVVSMLQLWFDRFRTSWWRNKEWCHGSSVTMRFVLDSSQQSSMLVLGWKAAASGSQWVRSRSDFWTRWSSFYGQSRQSFHWDH